MHNVVLSLDGRKEVNDNMRPTLMIKEVMISYYLVQKL